MKFSFLSILLVLSIFTRAQDRFSGSTPADPIVRNFLGIALSDSIDFIRWRLTIDKSNYTLLCNYGISKPNTNGFEDGGQSVKLEGRTVKSSGNLTLYSGSKELRFYTLNNNLLHPLNSDGSILIGNAGWSYTLSRISPLKNTHSIFTPVAFKITDSIAYLGRTPCLPRGMAQQSDDCYKMKWTLTIFSSKESGEPISFRIRASVTKHQSRMGTCTQIQTNANGVIYQFQVDDHRFYIKPFSQNILILTDKDGEALVGNEDFSFTLNRAL